MNINNFFDDILLTNSELIHSAVLKWLLNLSEANLSTEMKINFISKLFGIEKKKIKGILTAKTEIHNIDILVRTADYLFIIENKLRSSQHSGQLKKYQEEVKTRYSVEFGNNIEFYFLTLIEEKANITGWKNISYEHLLECYNTIQFSNKSSEYIFTEYKYSLQNLIDSYEDFNQNTSNYKNVFTDGDKKKHEKDCSNLTSYQEYICKHQLETVFQKAYFTRIASFIPNSKFIDYYITETHGNALIQFINKIFYYNGQRLELGLQFQNGTFKINLRGDHTISIKETNENNKKYILGSDLLDLFTETFRGKNGYKRYQPPSAHIYCSVTKKIDNNFYLITLTEIVENIIAELKYIEQKWNIFSENEIIKI